jgi:hypothetical protein
VHASAASSNEKHYSVSKPKCLGKKSGPKRDEVCEQLMISHNKELHDLSRLPIIIRRLRWTGSVIQMEETRNVYKIFLEKPLGK